MHGQQNTPSLPLHFSRRMDGSPKKHIDGRMSWRETPIGFDRGIGIDCYTIDVEIRTHIRIETRGGTEGGLCRREDEGMDGKRWDGI